jgi:hypothetical protein
LRTHQSFHAPVEAKVAFVLFSDHAFYYASAEALTRRLLDRRTAPLSPSEDELVACHNRPFDLNTALGHRKSPVLGRIDKASDAFQSAINRYQGVILSQAQQSAACHAIHSIEARLCRWLLLSQDITGSEEISLTQEFLSHMLGVQRSSVSLCAHTLQKTGLIQYARGKIKIRNRKGLEECACECYSVTREYIASVIRPERRTPPQGVVL